MKLPHIDISSEKWREYVYADGSTFRVDFPATMYVAATGDGESHCIVDLEGVRHSPTSGWIGIRWYSTNDAPILERLDA